MLVGPEPFVDPTLALFLKLFVALLFGGIIGIERSVLARQPVGTRTFALVVLGICLFVMMSNYVDSAYLGVDLQPLQLAASVVTGIEFIGAGLIIVRNDTVHGINTAAGLWIATAIGIAVGYGPVSGSYLCCAFDFDRTYRHVVSRKSLQTLVRGTRQH